MLSESAITADIEHIAHLMGQLGDNAKLRAKIDVRNAKCGSNGQV